MYLTSVPTDMVTVLIGLIGQEARQLANGTVLKDSETSGGAVPDILKWEDQLAHSIAVTPQISETEREALIMARRGQGLFKKNVQKFERRCRLTGVEKIEHLIASHCKPWRDCVSNEERLDGENGMLLTPNVDHLFDRGFISFEDDGTLLVSPVAHNESLRRMGIPVDQVRNVGGFSEGQRRYLEFHRESLFLAARL